MRKIYSSREGSLRKRSYHISKLIVTKNGCLIKLSG